MGGHNGCSVAELSLAEVRPIAQVFCTAASLKISFRGAVSAENSCGFMMALSKLKTRQLIVIV